MLRFESMIEYVLKWEGEYSDSEFDKGGETNYGISKATFPEIDVKNLTLEEAKKLYKKYYYNPNRHLFDDVDASSTDPMYVNRTQRLQMELFDSIINMGQGNAMRVLQTTLNVFSPLKLVEDGVAGTNTKLAWNSLIQENCEQALLYAFRATRECYYKLIVKSSPSQEKFLRGWLRRAHGNYELF